MTTPRDAIAGLSERLREVERAELDVASQADCRPEDTANYYYAEVCHNAATQLDSLLKERDALQARVKELEARCSDQTRTIQNDYDLRRADIPLSAVSPVLIRRSA